MGISFVRNDTFFSRSNQASNSRIEFSRHSAILAYMDNYQFERRLVEIFAELIESKGLRHEPTAELAWPDKKDAGPA